MSCAKQAILALAACVVANGCYLSLGPDSSADGDGGAHTDTAGPDDDFADWFGPPPPVRGTYLVGYGNEIIGIDQDGAEVDRIPVPTVHSNDGTISNLDVLQDGTIAVFLGQRPPELALYDRESGNWEHHTDLPWFWGADAGAEIFGYGPYVFADDESHPSSPSEHLLRFDRRSATWTRERSSMSSFTLGLHDGLIYRFAPGGEAMLRLDPRTLEEVGELPLPGMFGAGGRSQFVVGANGHIYLAEVLREPGYIRHFDAEGRDLGVASLPDRRNIISLDVAADGTLVISGGLGDIVTADPDLQEIRVVLDMLVRPEERESRVSVCSADPYPLAAP